MKMTRHNGRSGKNGSYNPKHNDRRFDTEKSDHIDSSRTPDNVYWDWINGYGRTGQGDGSMMGFEAVEEAFYTERYLPHIEAQNGRNAINRHTERNRTVGDLLKNRLTCPEESIFQIGTVDEHVPPDVLLGIVTEFMGQFQERFGSHVHILDWALHLDEGTPHIHERHVFDCANRYGETCPQQEKALEALGIPLPDPGRPKGRNNNRKQAFDALCREMLLKIAKEHGIDLDKEPVYGGRKYMEKQDFILARQTEKISRQNETAARNSEAIALQAAKIERSDTVIGDRQATMDRQAEVIASQREEAARNAGIITAQQEETARNAALIATQQAVLTSTNAAISEREKKLKEQDEEITVKRKELDNEQMKLDRVKLKVSDIESLVDGIADSAYEKACEAVADAVREETQKEDLKLIDRYTDWVLSPETPLPADKKNTITKHMSVLRDAMVKQAQKVGSRVKAALHRPETARAGKEKTRKAAKESLQARLEAAAAEAERQNRDRQGKVLTQRRKDSAQEI